MIMKKTIYAFVGLIAGLSLMTWAYAQAANPVTFPVNGGTGTSTKPSTGYVLVGLPDGTYAPVATSTLGFGTGSGSGIILTGTQGYFPFYNSNATTTLTATSSIFITQGGKIGIGSTTPFKTLGVTGEIYVTATTTSPCFTTILGGTCITNNFASGNIVPGTTSQISYYASATTTLTPNPVASLDSSGNLSANSGSFAAGVTVGFPNQRFSIPAVDTGYEAFNVRLNGGLVVNTITGGSVYGFGVGNPLVTNSTNIGIGTSTPFKALTVIGEVYTTATTTSPCFTNTLGGTCIVTSGGTVGSGTTGQFPYYAASGTTLTATSTLFIFGSNIGIGTTTPAQAITIVGSTGIKGSLIDAYNSPGSLGNILTSTGTSTYWAATSSLLTNYFKQGGNSFGTTGLLGTSDGQPLSLITGGNARMTFLNSNSAGIGTTNPGSILQLNSASTALDATLSMSRNSTAFSNGMSFGASSGVGHFFSDTLAGDAAMRADGTGAYLRLGTNGASSSITVSPLFNVGIGSTTPGLSELTVQGQAGANPIFTAASSTFASQFTIDAKGHLIYGGNKPTINSCGSGATVQTGSSDKIGRLQVGTTLALTSCVINFADTWTNPPICDANVEGGLTVFTSASSTASTLTITGASTFTGDTITFQCSGF